MFFADRGSISDETMTFRAVLVYATFMATNRFRHVGAVDRAVAVQAMIQFCQNAVQGLARSRRILDSRWVSQRVEADGSVGSRRQRARRAAQQPGDATRSHHRAAAWVSGAPLVTGSDWRS